jgi:hypothetical protein
MLSIYIYEIWGYIRGYFFAYCHYSKKYPHAVERQQM